MPDKIVKCKCGCHSWELIQPNEGYVRIMKCVLCHTEYKATTIFIPDEGVSLEERAIRVTPEWGEIPSSI